MTKVKYVEDELDMIKDDLAKIALSPYIKFNDLHNPYNEFISREDILKKYKDVLTNEVYTTIGEAVVLKGNLALSSLLRLCDDLFDNGDAVAIRIYTAALGLYKNYLYDEQAKKNILSITEKDGSLFCDREYKLRAESMRLSLNDESTHTESRI